MARTLTATFSDGSRITRRTPRHYEAAWRCTFTNSLGVGETCTGWAFTNENAIKRMASWKSQLVKVGVTDFAFEITTKVA